MTTMTHNVRLRRRQRQKEDELKYLYRSLIFGSMLMGSCLCISLLDHYQASYHFGSPPRAATPLDGLWRLRLRGPTHSHSTTTTTTTTTTSATKKQLSYTPPPRGTFPPTVWTMDTFDVHGINLAHYGFESEQQDDNNNSSNKLFEPFELYQDFDISLYIRALDNNNNNNNGGESGLEIQSAFDNQNHNDDEMDDNDASGSTSASASASESSAAHLLLYHRHLEHPSLAFYLDRIAQKRYWQAVGIPVVPSRVLKYKDELLSTTLADSYVENSLYDNDMEDAVRELLSHQDKNDFVVKASHRRDTTIVVSYDPQLQQSVMMDMHQQTNNDKDDKDKTTKVTLNYNTDTVVQQLTEALHQQRMHFMDPWSIQFVTPGIVVEDRFVMAASSQENKNNEMDNTTSSTLLPPLHLHVYVIWGQVWIATWTTHWLDNHNKEPVPPTSTSTSVIYRNGIVFSLHNGGTTKTQEEQRQVAEMPHWLPWKQVVQIAEEIGAHKDFYQVNMIVGIPATATATTNPQLVVTGGQLDPLVQFPDPGLLNELGRLWLAGYQMGIYKSIPNREVPSEFLSNQKLTEQDAKLDWEQNHHDGSILWKIKSALF